MKCGAQMRLALIEPRDLVYDVLTYNCTPRDSSESFLNDNLRLAIPCRVLSVQHGGSGVRQHRPLFPYFDQTKFGQNPKIIVADRRHFQPARLDVAQRPAQPDGPFERKTSERIISHSRRLVRHFDQTLAVRRLLLADADNAVIAHPVPITSC